MLQSKASPHQNCSQKGGQVYTLDELAELVRLYGLPQDWNPDGALGPDRYIEAQVWDDALLRAFL